MTRSPATLVVVALAAVAAWVSLGTLAVTSIEAGAPRIGLLPPWWVLGLCAVASAAAVTVLSRRGYPRAPWLISTLVLLPWLPVPVPVACLIWTGPIVWLVWAAVGLGLIAARPRDGGRPARAALADPRRAPATAAVVGFLVFSGSAWLAAPSVPGGDEPHYLIITQSLLRDFDLKIENNHARREYTEYLGLPDLKPDFLRRGADGEIYSIHAPGLSALVAPAFAVAGYRGVELLLLLVSALGAALAWRLAWRATGDAGAAWFGCAAVCLSPTWVFQTFTVYPDGLGALLTLIGVWALVRLGALDAAEPLPRTWELALFGAALATLPWLHTRFALIAAALGLMIVARIAQRYPWRAGVRAAGAFLAVPLLGAAAWFGLFYAIYGTPDPRAPYGAGTGGRWAYVTSGLGGLFLDQQFGLLAYAPVLLAGLGGLAVLATRRSSRRLAIELGVVMVPYLLAVTHFRMWWAGRSAPARFFTPLLLVLALPAAAAWARTTSRASRAALGSALAFTGLATLVLVAVDGGRLAFNDRDGFALWLGWMARLADLPRGLPSFHRSAEGAAFLDAAIWGGVLVAMWVGLRFLERSDPGKRVSMAAAAPLACGLAVMVASTAVWWSNGASGLAPAVAQLNLIHAAANGRGVGVSYAEAGLLSVRDVPTRLSIDTDPRFLQSRDRPLFVLPGLPAGDYRLQIQTGASAAGRLDFGIAREPFVLQQFAVADAAAAGGSVVLRCPVTVRALVVRGDEAARGSVTRLALQPLSVLAPAERVADGTAIRAIGYPGGAVYFFDGGAFVEHDAFWVRGGRATDVVVLPRPTDPRGGPVRAASLFVRNAPVENRLTVEAGRWHQTLELAPREERTLEIPMAPGQTAVEIRLATTAGFTPAEVEPGSRDVRFLGVWVTMPP